MCSVVVWCCYFARSYILTPPVARQNLASHRREPGTPTTDACLGEGLPKNKVHCLGEQPGAAIAHTHGPTDGGNVPGFFDRL